MRRGVICVGRGTATAPRSRLGTDERRAQLLELGVEIFGAKNYDEVSIDEIAKRAGISKGLLYHYFSNKREFYVACVRAGAEAFEEAVQPDKDLPPIERVYQGLERYLDFVEARADAYQTLLSSGIGVDPEVAEIVNRCRRGLADRMVTDAGITTPIPPLRNLARAWIGAVEASSLDWLEHRDIERDALIQTLVGMLVSTLQTVLDGASVLDEVQGA
nr:uncharacterized HTH-type transcriptional regulator MT0489-like [Nerophis lumbriciformis]